MKILIDARNMLERMEHRGACSCDNASGDGAGVMTAVPDKLYRKELRCVYADVQACRKSHFSAHSASLCRRSVSTRRASSSWRKIHTNRQKSRSRTWHGAVISRLAVHFVERSSRMLRSYAGADRPSIKMLSVLRRARRSRSFDKSSSPSPTRAKPPTRNTSTSKCLCCASKQRI